MFFRQEVGRTSVIIKSVERHSPAEKAALHAGDALVSINGNSINDILDFRFYETDQQVALELLTANGEQRCVTIRKGEYQPLGLDFETYLIDKQRSCCNKCVFCFIDQLPKGMRESLYFKDDDERLSFLFGNYITLTNLSDAELERIIKMHISPVNVSVHATDPELRVRMMKNPRAAKVMERLRMLADGGIKLNCQLVLCPGYNDGEALERTLRDLSGLMPQIQSIALAPVGLTRHREGLEPLRLFTPSESAAIIDLAERFSRETRERTGSSLVWAADEFYIKAERAFPDESYYEDYPQLENGVGLVSLLQSEFADALEHCDGDSLPHQAVIATGVSAAPILKKLISCAQIKWPNADWRVIPIRNVFFGENITVAGLVTGGDLIEQLTHAGICGRVLIPSAMLRHEGDMFLDSVTLDEAEKALGVSITPVPNSGYELLAALLG